MELVLLPMHPVLGKQLVRIWFNRSKRIPFLTNIARFRCKKSTPVSCFLRAHIEFSHLTGSLTYMKHKAFVTYMGMGGGGGTRAPPPPPNNFHLGSART